MFTGYHGTNGPMTTRLIDNVPIVEKFIKAGGEMEWQELEDYNGPELDGIHYIYVIFINIAICFSSSIYTRHMPCALHMALY